MKRLTFPVILAGVFAVTSVAAPALAEAPAAPAAPAAMDASDGATDTVLLAARHRPPPRYRTPPPRRYRPYRPPPRRVYRPPTYVPAPRRAPVVVAPDPDYRPFFHLGLGLNGTSIIDDDATANSGFDAGAGFEIDFGLRLGPQFSLDFGWWASFHDVASDVNSAALMAFTIDGRFFLTDQDQRLQPYLQAGVGAYVMTYDDALNTLSGPGFQLGGGFDFYLTPGVSLGGRLLYRGAYVEYDDPYYYNVESSFISAFTYGADIKFHF